MSNKLVDFSYIIPYRSTPERDKNLHYILEWLKNFNCEIIVVELDNMQKLNFNSAEINHIFVKNDGPFNRSWACNIGFKKSNNNIIAFGDADIFIAKELMLKGLVEIENFEVVSPYSRVIDLDESETLALFSNKKNANLIGKERPGITIAGGTIFFKRSAFENICGWPEDFVGWGGEDDFMSWKINVWLDSKILDGEAHHLWHVSAPKDELLYEKNLALLKKCEAASTNDLVNWILSSKDKIGQIPQQK